MPWLLLIPTHDRVSGKQQGRPGLQVFLIRLLFSGFQAGLEVSGFVGKESHHGLVPCNDQGHLQGPFEGFLSHIGSLKSSMLVGFSRTTTFIDGFSPTKSIYFGYPIYNLCKPQFWSLQRVDSDQADKICSEIQGGPRMSKESLHVLAQPLTVVSRYINELSKCKFGFSLVLHRLAVSSFRSTKQAESSVFEALSSRF